MPSLEELEKSENVVELLKPKKLIEIGEQVKKGYEIDLDSRRDWERDLAEATRLVKQVFEEKRRANLAKAASIKMPLLTKAVIDFAARVYKEHIQGNKVVHIKTIGADANYRKDERGVNVSRCMNFQLLDKNSEWETEHDKLLHVYSTFGIAYKKVYYDALDRRNVSELIAPSDIIINNSVTSLEKAPRITHRMFYSRNEIEEQIRLGYFTKVDFDKISETYPDLPSELKEEAEQNYDYTDPDAPYELLEQHCYLDLDEDGYAEPYIVTLHAASCQVLRIVNRFKKIDRRPQEDGTQKLIRIVPEHFFIDFHYIPSPDGSYHSLGLGKLLLPINESANTLMEQILDAGTMANSQTGLIGASTRIKARDIELENGKYKILDIGGAADLRSSVLPLPAPQPSPVLLNCLGIIMEAGKDIASTNDMLEGKMSGTNVPATTSMMLAENGLKVYNAIVKRLYRSMKKEFSRLFYLNQKHLTQKEYEEILDNPSALVDVDFATDDLDIVPIADPSNSSDVQRISTARAIMEAPGGDPWEKSYLYYKALRLEEEEIQRILGPKPPPDAPPPAEIQKIMAETQKLNAETQEIMAGIQNAITKLQIEDRNSLTLSEEAQARIEKMLADQQVNREKMEVVADKSTKETEIKIRNQIASELVNEHDRKLKEIEQVLKAAELQIKKDTEAQKAQTKKTESE